MCGILYCVVIHYHVNAYCMEHTEEVHYEANSEANFFWAVFNFRYGLSTGYSQSREESTTSEGMYTVIVAKKE